LVFGYYIHQSDVQMVKQIFDNKIDNTKLIELKIPVSMPTIQDWTEYEEIVGQIQLKDAYYTYVRLKMTRDTMYLICLANTTKTQLVKANIIAAKEISDVPVNKKGQEPVSKRVNTLSEYNLQSFKYHYGVAGSFFKHECNSLRFRWTNPFIESPGKPPNFIS